MIKNTYFTSDWHINEFTTITLNQRPYSNLRKMHKALINNYNNKVRSNDICYFLGDMGNTKDNAVKDIIEQLNGTKILIKGNHDNKGNQFYLDCGFTTVLNGLSFLLGKQLVTASHCPLHGIHRENIEGMRGAVEGDNWHGESKHGLKYSFPDFGQFHLHGHIHSPNSGKSKRILGRQMDVGVDANKYKPVSLSQIESFISRYHNESKSSI